MKTRYFVAKVVAELVVIFFIMTLMATALTVAAQFGWAAFIVAGVACGAVTAGLIEWAHTQTRRTLFFVPAMRRRPLLMVPLIVTVMTGIFIIISWSIARASGLA